MNIKLSKSSINDPQSVIRITGSKSESNRLLLLQALYPEVNITNLSNSDDTTLMQHALNSDSHEIDIHHAGTAMRFLTAFYSIQKARTVILTGSNRMQERPIRVLVDALHALGADISYVKNEGFPPLLIKGKQFLSSEVEIDANVSSQYISALLLIAPKLNNGLKIKIKGSIASKPYLLMTISLLNDLGAKTVFKENTIIVEPLSHINIKSFSVESDWSSASYFYSIIALSKIGKEISLSLFRQNSLQGDAILAEIYESFGVETIYNEDVIILRKVRNHTSNSIQLNLTESPDIAQTLAVTCLGLGLTCKLTGLETLKIKETDRLVALKTEIEKLGTNVEITDHSLCISNIEPLMSNIDIDTYNDHRMAMAFSPLALKTPIIINDSEVVSKSYPDFWNDLKTIGFQISK